MYFPVHGHLHCFYLLTIVDNAIVNIGHWYTDICLNFCFQFFSYIPKSRITESYSIPIFNFLRNMHTVFHTGRIILTSHHQSTRVIISPYPPQWFFFNKSPPNACTMVFHCGFDLQIFNDQWCRTFFSCSDWSFIYLWRNICSNVLPI